MKIWVVEIGEPITLLEPKERPHRYGTLTRFLAQRGHQVEWFTSSFSHAPKKHLTKQDQVLKEGNLTLHVLKGLGYPRSISVARFRHQAHFAKRLGAYWESMKESKPDILLTGIPTLESALLVTSYGLKHGIPACVDIRDEWPEEFVRLAPARLRPLVRPFFYRMFRQASEACANAAAIFAVAPRQLEYGLKLASRKAGRFDRVCVLGYPKTESNVSDLESARAFWKAHGLAMDGSEFILCFFGTIGKFFELATPLELAAKMKSVDGRKLRFVFAGSGGSLERFKNLNSKLGAGALFPGWVNQAQIQALMQESAAGLAPYSKGVAMELPNKVFEYLSGSLPVISSLSGEFQQIVEERGIGANYEPDSVEGLEGAIRRVLEHPSNHSEMKYRAGEFFNNHYEQDKVLSDWESHLEMIVREKH